MKNFVLANISDVLSTLFGMQLGAIEVNPFLSSLMAATSVPEALLVKLALACGVGYLVWRWRPSVLKIPTLAFALIAMSNVVVILTQL
jgi:hypothetical protein